MKKILLIALSVSALVGGSRDVQAATKWWDLNDITAGAGDTPSGIWDAGTTANWNTSSAGTAAVSTWTALDNARFSAGTDAVNPYTVTVSGNVSVGQIGLEEAATVTFTGGQITFTHVAGGTSILTGVSAISTTAIINSQISGTAGFKVARNTGLANNVTLGNSANDFTGGFTINIDNTVHMGAANVIPVANLVTNGGTWNLNGFNQSVAGAQGAGAITLGSGTLTFNNTISKTYTGVISGTGGLVKNGNTSQVLSGNNTFSGGVVINAGPMYFITNGASGNTKVLSTGTGAITVNGTGQIGASAGTNDIQNAVILNTLTAGLSPANTGTRLTLSGQASGAGGFVRNSTGGGHVILAGDNIFTGGVQIDARTLGLGHRNALGTGTFTIGNATTAPAQTINLSTTTDLTGVNAIGNATTINQNFTVSGSSGFELSGLVTLAAGMKTNTVSSTALTKISGVISGSGGLAKAGTGTLTLSAANTYTDRTIVSAGTLALTGSGSISESSRITVATGATLDATGLTLAIGAGKQLDGSGTIIANNVTVGGTLAPGASPGVLTINGNLTLQDGSQTMMELGGLVRGTEYDGVDVSGALTFDGTLNVSPINAFAPAEGNSFDLFNFSSGSGTFDAINLPTLANDWSWNVSNLYTDGTIIVVPEPSTVALGLMGVAAVGFRMIRRRK